MGEVQAFYYYPKYSCISAACESSCFSKGRPVAPHLFLYFLINMYLYHSLSACRHSSKRRSLSAPKGAGDREAVVGFALQGLART